MVTTLSKLATAVSDTESATSPLASEVRKFDVTPPGATAISITPMAISGAKGQLETSRKPTSGNSNIWKTNPVTMSRGCVSKRPKSEIRSPSPKVNIMKAKTKGRTMSVTIPISNLVIQFDRPSACREFPQYHKGFVKASKG